MPVYPINYNWVGNILTFVIPTTDCDGVWIQFQQTGSNEIHTILQVTGSCPINCMLDPNIYGSSGEVSGVVKSKERVGYPPTGGKTGITNSPV